MTNTNEPSPQEYRALQLQLLEKMDNKLDDVNNKLVQVGERITKLETGDQSTKVKELTQTTNNHEIRLTQIETKGKVETGIIATIISALMVGLGVLLKSIFHVG